MGQRQDEDDIVYGRDCPLGYNLAAPLWLPGETPKYVYMRFSLIKKCDKEECIEWPVPPNDRVFKLTQSDVDPCYWQYLGDWLVEWQLRVTVGTWCSYGLYYPPGFKWYFRADFNTQGDDARFATNICTCEPFNMCGYDGIAVVTWKLEAKAILNSLNMKALSDIFMEMRPLVDGNKVYKFCRLEDATNIAIEYESD